MKRTFSALLLITAIPGICRAAPSYDNPTETFLLGVILLAVVGFVVYAVAYGGMKKPERNIFLEELRAAGAYTRQVSAGWSDLFLPHGDGAFVLHYAPSRSDWAPGEGGLRSVLTLSAGVSVPGAMRVRTEGAIDRLAEGAGLQGNIVTGDPGFDSQFQIEADNETFAARYFSSHEKRAAVKGLFAEGCADIKFAPEGITVYWHLTIDKSTAAGFVKNSLPYLTALARGIAPAVNPAPALAAGPLAATSRAGTSYRAILIPLLLASVFFMAVPSVGMQPVLRTPAFYASLPYSLPLLAAALLAGMWALKGKTWFKNAYLELAAYLLLGIPSAGYWVFCYVNSARDTASAVVRRVQVASTSTQSRKGGRSYDMKLAHWSGTGAIEMSISGALYKRINGAEQYQTVLLTVKPGSLGHEWIVSWRMAPPSVPARGSSESRLLYGI